MSTLLISIITPVYNGMPYLEECIKSVLSQENPYWELLISDDSSTDGSRDFLNSLNDSRIRIFKQEKNLGIFGNLNFLFQRTKAPISQILCQDDYFINSQSIDYILDYWNHVSEDIGYVRFNHCYKAKYLEVFQQKILPSTIMSHDADLFFYVFGNIPGNLSNISLRTTLVHDCGGFNQDFPYAGDFEFWIRAAQMNNIGISKQHTTYIRRHAGAASISFNQNGELVSQKRIIVNSLFNRLKIKYPQNYFLLKIVGTLNYDTLQRDAGIRQWIHTKRNKYIKEVIYGKDDFSFSEFINWILYVASVGGRIGRVGSAKYLLKVLLKNKL